MRARAGVIELRRILFRLIIHELKLRILTIVDLFFLQLEVMEIEGAMWEALNSVHKINHNT